MIIYLNNIDIADAIRLLTYKSSPNLICYNERYTSKIAISTFILYIIKRNTNKHQQY